jgi:hypothetical protein
LYTKKASEIAEKLYISFCKHGAPLKMISDNGGGLTLLLLSFIYRKYWCGRMGFLQYIVRWEEWYFSSTLFAG